MLHHVAFDGKVEVVEMMANLPYYREIVDDNSNEVLLRNLDKNSMAGPLCCGL